MLFKPTPCHPARTPTVTPVDVRVKDVGEEALWSPSPPPARHPGIAYLYLPASTFAPPTIHGWLGGSI